MTRPRPREPAPMRTKLASARQRLRGSGSASNSVAVAQQQRQQRQRDERADERVPVGELRHRAGRQQHHRRPPGPALAALEAVGEQQQQYAGAERERGGERAERAGQHLGDGVHPAVPEAREDARRRCPEGRRARRLVPTRTGTASGRGPRSTRRTRVIGRNLARHFLIYPDRHRIPWFCERLWIRSPIRASGDIAPSRTVSREERFTHLTSKPFQRPRKARTSNCNGSHEQQQSLALAVLAAVLLFAGTVWLWPRLARRSWRAVGGRIGLLLATQLALFVAVGLAANQAFGFYASWADLFGQETGPGRGRRPLRRRRARSSCRSTADRGTCRAAAAPAASGGQIQKVDIVGPNVDTSPAPRTSICRRSTSSRSTATRTFPAAVVLTGYPGTARDPGEQARTTRARPGAGQGRPDAADDPGDAAADRGAAAGHRVRGHTGRAADRDVLRQGPARRRCRRTTGWARNRAAGASSATPRAATAR